MLADWVVLGDNKVMARPESRPFTTGDGIPELPQTHLRVFEIERFRGEITKVEDELAEAKSLVIQKEAQLKALVQKWRDAGLLGR